MIPWWAWTGRVPVHDAVESELVRWGDSRFACCQGRGRSTIGENWSGGCVLRGVAPRKKAQIGGKTVEWSSRRPGEWKASRIPNEEGGQHLTRRSKVAAQTRQLRQLRAFGAYFGNLQPVNLFSGPG